MRIFILGGGSVGRSIALQLGQEGHDITLMDRDPKIIRSLENHIDGFLTTGNAASPTDLKAAGIEQADVMVAVTDSDEANIVACLWAEKLGHTVRIARIRLGEYSEDSVELPDAIRSIDRIINPERLTVEGILRLVETPSANEAFDFYDGNILLRGFIVPEDAPLVGKSLNHIRRVCQMDHFLVVAILRDEEVIIPRGDEVILAGDNIFVLMPQLILPLFLPLVNRYIGDVKRVVISGATRVGVDLAQRLEGQIQDVILMDHDLTRCERAAEVLTSAQVMHGKATEVEFLRECKIDAADLFVAVGPDDEKNLISALLARQHVKGRIILMTDNPDMVPVLKSAGPDVAINPKLLTVSHIMENIRHGRVLSVFKLKDNMAEAVEVVLSDKSPLVGKALKDIKFPKGAIIGAVCTDNVMVIPDGSTVLEGGQRIIVFSTEEAVEALEKLWV